MSLLCRHLFYCCISQWKTFQNHWTFGQVVKRVFHSGCIRSIFSPAGYIGATTIKNLWDASPPTVLIMGPSVFGFLQLLQLAVIFAGHCGKLTVLPQTSLLYSRGEGKKGREWLKLGRSSSVWWGRDGGGKESGSASNAPEVPSNFTAVVAPVTGYRVHYRALCLQQWTVDSLLFSCLICDFHLIVVLYVCDAWYTYLVLVE